MEQKEKKPNLKQYKKYFKDNFYFLKIAYKASPTMVIMQFFFNIAYSIFDYFYSIIFIGYIFNAVENQTPFENIVIILIVITLLIFIMQFFGAIYEYRIQPIGMIKIAQELNKNIFKKAADVEIGCYEDSEFYEKYTRALNEADKRVEQVMQTMANFIGNLLSFIILIITIIYLNPYALIFLIIPILIQYQVASKLNKNTYDLDKKNTESNRVKNYLNRIIYLEPYAKELRLTNIFNVLMKNYNKAYEKLKKNYLKYGKKIAKYRGLNDVFGKVMVFPLTIVYVALCVLVFKTIKFTNFIVLLNATRDITWRLYGVTEDIRMFAEYSLYIENLQEFLNYKPKISQAQDGITPNDKLDIFELDNVSFTYDGTDTPVLKGINIKIENGKKIALVGHNGAGKTTLIKLIMRLYDPTDGEITLNDINIKDYNVCEYRSIFGTVFQDYKVMAMSVADNLVMRKSKESEHKNLIDSLNKVGVYDKILDMGGNINSTMTREFDDNGLIMSSGETQKISISRIFANESQIAILDEPSSALDPIAEYNMFSELMKASKDKAVIFISHRLSSAVLADTIYLLENGEVIEKGSHKELMDANGKYAEMFNKQAENYKYEVKADD